MAAWRGKRAMTWITGAVAFFTSIGTAFTGYLVQTNFDSQWIGAEAKDGINSVGIGAWFNVLNVGQALLIHVALLPLVLGGLVVVARAARTPAGRGAADRPAHRRLRPGVRRGHRAGPTGSGSRRARASDPATLPWRGPKRRYDLVKEFAVALVVVSVADRRAGGVAQLARREGHHAAEVGHRGAGGLRRHGLGRARRQQRHGDLRRAVQHRRTPARASGRCHLQRWAGVRHPGRRGQELRPRPAAHDRRDRPRRCRPRWPAGTAPTPTSSRSGPRPTPKRSARRPTATRPRSGPATTARCRR